MSILKNDNINWILPILFSKDEYAIAIGNLSNKLQIKNPIKYAYGTIKCKWSLNFDSFMKFEDLKYIEKVLQTYQNFSITPLINFSQYDLTSKDLDDVFCNKFLELSTQYNSEFIVASDVLFDYIKNKYPNSIITSSVMYPKLNYQGIDDKAGECSLYNELITKFDKVIVRPEFAKTHLLESIDKISDINKIQVPINDSCKMNCQHFKDCFNITSSNFVCPKDIDEKLFGIKSKFTNLCIIEKDLINNFTKSKINNLILSSYNIPISFLETIFNEYMFNTEGDFQKYSQIIRYNLNDLIKRNIFHSEFQKNFFSMNFYHRVNLLEI